MKKFLIKAIIIIGVLMLYNYFQISKLYINRLELRNNKLRKDLKILHISDFHGNEFLKLDNIYENVDKFAPDLIVLTGDMIDRYTYDIDYTIDFIKKIYEINDNIYFISGNHELENKRGEEFLNRIESIGVNLLNDSSSYCSLGENELIISGFGFYSDRKIYDDLSTRFLEESYNILITHRPDKLLDYLNGREDLILSGHTHGGQVRLPFIGAVLAPDQGFFPKLDKGVFYLDDATLHIDSGAGNSFLPIRFLNRIQISNIVIKSS